MTTDERAAKHAQILDEQFTAAMLAIDLALTGKNKANNVSQYGTLEQAAQHAVLYLSDGGYTRLVVHGNEDDGWRLTLLATGASAERVQQKWNDGAAAGARRKVLHLVALYHDERLQGRETQKLIDGLTPNPQDGTP